MNDDDFEQRLAALRPADLPRDLQARLAAPPVVAGKIRWLWAATVPLAAAAVWLFTPTVQPPAPRSAPKPSAPQLSNLRVYLPVHRSSTLVSVENLAVIDAGPAHTVRLVRATWIDDVTYAGDDGHSTIHHREPRAQIIPVALTAY